MTTLDTDVLILGAGDDCAVMREEIFGPLLPVRTYRSIDEVIARVNAGPRPLALYWFGPRDAECEALLARTTSGNVGINSTLIHVAQDDLPFGGIGASGMGAYHGKWGFEALSHRRAVLAKPNKPDLSLMYPPYTDRAIKIMRKLM